MSNVNSNSPQQQIIEQSLRERMATLEATNDFHRETLNDISSSLREVVKTQHVLANQRDEIHKLIKVVSEIQTDMVSFKQNVFEVEYKSQAQTEQIKMLLDRCKRLREEVDANTHFIKTAAKIISAIAIPMILAIINQYIG